MKTDGKLYNRLKSARQSSVWFPVGIKTLTGILLHNMHGKMTTFPLLGLDSHFLGLAERIFQGLISGGKIMTARFPWQLRRCRQNRILIGASFSVISGNRKDVRFILMLLEGTQCSRMKHLLPKQKFRLILHR